MDSTLAINQTSIEKTLAALKERGVAAEIVDTRADALARIKAIIPAGVTVMTGASLTLKEIGLEDYLISKAHPWKNLKDAIVAESHPGKQVALRKQALLADFSWEALAVAETGELVIASASGSRSGRTPSPPRTSYGSSERRRSSRASMRASDG